MVTQGGSARRLLDIGLGALVLVSAYLLVCYVVLDLAIRPWRRPMLETPVTAGLDAEAVAFETEGGGLTLRGFWLHGSTTRVIVLLHGLDSNCWSGWYRELSRAYVAEGYHVLLFNLRGHGDSDPSPLGLAYEERHDVRGAVDWLLHHGFESGSIGIHGTSYGAATALIAAAYIPEIAAVVSDSAFADFRDVLDGEAVRRIGPAARLLKPGLMMFLRLRVEVPLDRISPLAAVPQIAPRPILFIHGEADTRIPPEETRKLAAVSRSPGTETWFVPRAGHARAFEVAGGLYLKKVLAFFGAHLEGPGR